MDSWEKPNVLAGIQTSAAEIKSGQREFATPEERQDTQMKEEQARMMAFCTGLAKAFNAGHKFPEARNLEWKMVVNIARQGEWIGEDRERLAVLNATVVLTNQYRAPGAELMKHFRPRDDQPEAAP